jgi:nuclear GTP-binding protein
MKEQLRSGDTTPPCCTKSSMRPTSSSSCSMRVTCRSASSRSLLVEEEIRRREVEGEASRSCAQQNRRVSTILSPLHLKTIDIRPYCCNVDLVPRENTQACLKHLRHTTQTLPFRSACPHQRTNPASGTAPTLPRLFKAYKPSAAQSFTVGVVGFHNQRR